MASPGEIEKLVERLQTGSWQEQYDALVALKEAGPPTRPFAFQPVAETLTHRRSDEADDSLLRGAAARALGSIGGVDAEAPLLAAAEIESDWVVLCDVAEMLGTVGGSNSFALLRRLLDHDVEPVRSYSAQSLGLLGDVDAVPLLQAMIADEEPGPRTAALGALLRLGIEEGAALLAETASSKDPEVAYCALHEMRFVLEERPIDLPATVIKKWEAAARAYRTDLGTAHEALALLALLETPVPKTG